MNQTHLHLVVNHLPVLGTAFGMALLLFGFWQKSVELNRTAQGVFVIISPLSAPACLTGEPVDDGVKFLPGASKPIIEYHEEAAAVAFTGAIVIGVAALAGLLRFCRGWLAPPWFAYVMLTASPTVTGLMPWTVNVSDQIRYAKIWSRITAPAVSGVKAHN